MSHGEQLVFMCKLKIDCLSHVTCHYVNDPWNMHAEQLFYQLGTSSMTSKVTGEGVAAEVKKNIAIFGYKQ